MCKPRNDSRRCGVLRIGAIGLAVVRSLGFRRMVRRRIVRMTFSEPRELVAGDSECDRAATRVFHRRSDEQVANQQRDDQVKWKGHSGMKVRADT